MKHNERRIRKLWAATAMFGLLTACGSGDDTASPSSLPFEEITTTVVESPATSETTADDAGAPDDAAPALTSEMFEGMLETDSGRALLVGGITSETNLGQEAAECLVDVLPLDILVEAASSFLVGEAEGGFLPADRMDEVAQILDTCGIASEDLLP